jgi:Xaa-Pro aminopeptidase
MLTELGCKSRCERLWRALPANLDWALVSDPRHLMYFANYCNDPFVFSSDGDSTQLLLGRDGSSVLIIDNMGEAFAQRAFVGSVVVSMFYDGTHTAAHRKALGAEVALLQLESRSISYLAVEGGAAPGATVAGFLKSRDDRSVFDMDDTIRQLRRCKDPDEVDLLREIMRVAAEGHAAGLAHTLPGMTELDVYMLVSGACARAAQRQVTVYGDFVSGERALLGGGGPTQRIIERGDLCILDFSVSLFGYRCDFANSFVVGAAPSEAQRNLHQACLAALSAGERLLQPGESSADIYYAVRSSFVDDGVASWFPHHAGHGIGLNHLESPFLVPHSTEFLQVGDVVTIEPGLYKQGVGGMRVERNYLITSNGFELLSKHDLSLEQASPTYSEGVPANRLRD